MADNPLDDWDYALPRDRIATRPPQDRDGGRLLVLPRIGGGWSHRMVRDLPSLLAPGDLLVANDSRVLPARLRATRSSGGAVEVLCLDKGPGPVPALLRPARRLSVGEVLEVGDVGHVTVVALPNEEGIATVLVSPSPAEVMEAVGEMPLPPYMDRAADASDRERYQTVFAKEAGSVAAPTAGLHLTEALLEALRDRGVGFATVTLHVGIGTFRPLRPEDVARGRLHAEPWVVPAATADAIVRTRERGGRVVAIGTTACRTLESAAAPGRVARAGAGTTELFIRPPYEFGVVDGLLTNLHLPRSSLLMLVASLCGRERLLAAYEEAVREHYRFYSYGDAMLLL